MNRLCLAIRCVSISSLSLVLPQWMWKRGRKMCVTAGKTTVYNWVHRATRPNKEWENALSENVMACVSANNNISNGSNGNGGKPIHPSIHPHSESSVHRDVQLQVKRANERTDLSQCVHHPRQISPLNKRVKIIHTKQNWRKVWISQRASRERRTTHWHQSQCILYIVEW